MNREIYKNKSFQKELKKESEKVHVKSDFNFLMSHRGLRPKKSHILIAPTGAGKSTLLRSLIIDYLGNNPNKKILLYLTEETLEDFWTEIASIGYNIDAFKNLEVFSEQDYEDNNPQTVMNRFKMYADEFRPDVFFLDNLSTMESYCENDANPKAQTAIVKSLKRYAIYLNKPVFILAHVGGHFKDTGKDLIQPYDIRGCKLAVMQSEFIYTMQPIYINDTRKTFIMVKKFRGQNASNTVFRMEYDVKQKRFKKDHIVNFDEFKEVYNMRNKL